MLKIRKSIFFAAAGAGAGGGAGAGAFLTAITIVNHLIIIITILIVDNKSTISINNDFNVVIAKIQ